MRHVMYPVMGLVMALLAAGCGDTASQADGDRGDAGSRTPLARPPVRNPNPTAAKEGMEWSLKELGEHLKAKGVITGYELPARESETVFGKRVYNPMLVKNKDGGVVSVIRHNGAISAEDHVKDWRRGTKQADEYFCGNAYVWGVFSATPEYHNTREADTVFPVLAGHVKFGPLPAPKWAGD